MKVPEKYRTAGDFPSYYSGEKKVPYLTVFIGGNHEASNYLKTLPFGGYVAKDIYYMGATGILIIEKNNK
jgi:lariat debranching enzyme